MEEHNNKGREIDKCQHKIGRVWFNNQADNHEFRSEQEQATDLG